MGEMTPERFEELAEAYGGETARWPQAEREAAAALMAGRPGFAQAVLARADALDEVLDAWRPAPASAALLERVLAEAPRRRTTGLAAWIWRGAVGAGLAGACAAGLLMGVSLSTASGGGHTTDTLSAAMGAYDGDTTAPLNTSAIGAAA
ncbi:MAG TPA: hypothetical protein PK913_09460 [Phenylobacterium sp.]|uniref:hypothetical protein n=1 Tax=Phenylobacterium sp. TaxID=1871053 RepID=UPI002C59829C|nr:hypothetical protein [Phenylobacterium sp.]